jgi:ethanolamine utilization protein EutA
LREAYRFDAVFISGGWVNAWCIRSTNRPTALATSARCWRRRSDGNWLTDFPVREPAQTLRATVIGAGAHTLTLSGSTVWNKYQGVPLRNVPVIHPRLRWREFRPGAL